MEFIIGEQIKAHPMALVHPENVADAAERAGLKLEVLDIGKPEGRRIVADLGIRTVPAIVIDGTLRSVGSCTLNEALAMLNFKSQGS